MTHGKPSESSNPVQIQNWQADSRGASPETVKIVDQVTESQGRWTVSWSFSGSCTGFRITCLKKNEPQECTGALPATLTNFSFDSTMLDNNAFYSFQVRALNLNREGSASEPTDPIHTAWETQPEPRTSSVLLDAPQEVKVTYDDAQLKISWSSSSHTHAVAAKKHSSAYWSVLTDSISAGQADHVITGLEPMLEYDFSVAEINHLGASIWSTPIRALFGAKHPSAPSQPLKTTAEQRLDSITIGWSLPESDGGLTIDRYKVAVLSVQSNDPHAATKPPTQRIIQVGKKHEFRVDGLHPSTEYTFRVAAHNQVGWSSLSEPSPALSTAHEIAPNSNYWVQQMKKTLAVCVSVFVLITLVCGVCIYITYQQQKSEGAFEYRPSAWQEFKEIVKGQQEGNSDLL